MADKRLSDLTPVFERTLGRKPTQAEQSFFEKLFVDRSDISAFDIENMLAGTQAGQERLLNQQTGQFEQRLEQSDQRVLERTGETLQSRFTQQGRRFSSGFNAALVDAAQNLAQQRQQQVASFFGGGLQGVRQTAFGAGQTAERRFIDEPRAFIRARNLADESYFRQQNDFNNFLRGQQSRNLQSALTQGGLRLGGALIGGAAGGFFGGGIGAVAGASAGSSLAGGFAPRRGL